MTDLAALDDRVARGFSAGPRFQTTIVTSAGGREVRNSAWSAPRLVFNFSYSTLDTADARLISSFFQGRRGKQRSFLMKDWADYSATNEQIGTGNGSITSFQAIKTYDALNPYVRAIKFIKAATLSVTVNGSPATVSSEVNGLITLSSAPAAAAIIRASFEFYVPVRFDQDELQLTLDGENGRYAIISGLAAIEERA